MQRIGHAILGASAIIMACTGGAHAAIDPIYEAGQAYGISFFWVPVDPIAPDTLRGKCLCDGGGAADCPERPSLSAIAAGLAPHGRRLLRAHDCSAMALALLLEQDVSVCILSQWHAGLRSKTVVPVPGMPGKALRHAVVSDFHWERVERGQIGQVPGGVVVQLWFERAGRSEYPADQPLVGNNREILGTDGLNIRIVEFEFYEDLNIRRTHQDVIVVVPASLTLPQLTETIEKAMDRRGLDLSFRAPRFTEIAPPPPTAAPAE